MYKLNRKMFAGALVAGSIVLGLNMKITEENNSINTEKQNLYAIDTDRTLMIDQELNGCIVYKLQVKTKINGVWHEWGESSNYYLGSLDETYGEEYLETEDRIVKKIAIGVINNEYKQEDFQVIKRTYHEEVYESNYVDGHWEEEWKNTGESITLENNTELPTRCMGKWVLDREVEETKVPKKSLIEIQSWTVSYTEMQLQSDNTWKEIEREYKVGSNYRKPTDTKTVKYKDFQKVENIEYLPQLLQGYEITYVDGEIVYKPTAIFTTIENLPTSKYVWIPVGHYETSSELERNISASILIKV